MTLRRLIFSGLLLFLTPTAGLTAQYINVRIVNDSLHYDQRVEVTDNICGLIVLEKRIIAEGMVPAQICARGMDKGDVTIRNLESGAEQRYRDVRAGDPIKTP